MVKKFILFLALGLALFLPIVCHAQDGANFSISDSSAANTSTEGSLYYNIQSHKLRYKTNTGWRDVVGGSQSLSGYMTKAANLSDVVSSSTARTNLGLGSVDNTSDANKPVSTATQTALNAKLSDDPTFLGYQAMGSAFLTEAIGVPIQTANTSSNLTDNQIRFTAVYLPATKTVTGVKVYVRVLGSYTGDQNNRVGLYSYSNGTLTLVASSANSSSLWTSAANAFQTIAFSSTYAASPGIYFVALLYNNSAQVTAPAIASGVALNNAAMATLGFTNSAKLYGTLNGNDIPSSQVMSGVTATTVTTWVAIY